MINDQDIPALYRKLKPFIAKDRWQTGATGQSTTGSPTVSAHALYGAAHTGTLDRSQAPWVASDIAAAINTHNTVGDPHSQYVHISNARTISASHNFAHATVGFTSPDADSYFDLGRARAGYVGHTDYAGFAHRGYANNEDYALAQNGATGAVAINAPLLATLALRNADVDVLRVSESLVEVANVSAATLRSENYASQTTGWSLTYGGALDVRYLYADEMHVKAFIADLEQALAGGQIICKSVAKLAVDFIVPNYSATTLITVESFPGWPNAYVFTNGDTIGIKIVSRTNGSSGTAGSLTVGWLFGTVSGASFDTTNKRQTWTLTRLSSSTINGFAAGGTASAGSTVEAGAIVLDFGVSGNGYYEVNAIDGQMAVNSPYMRIYTWNTHPIYDATVRSSVGNLTGLGFTSQYGLYARGVDANQYLVAAGTSGILLRNTTLRMYDGSNNLFMQADTSGLNYYVQSSPTFADTTSVLFRQAGGTKIMQLTASNNSGAHEGALWVHDGSSDTVLNVIAEAPSSQLASIRIQATVGATSPQWIFSQLASGVIKADFPGYITFSGNPGSPTNHYGQIIVDPGNNDQDCFISMRTTRTGTDRTWLVGAGSGAGNTNFRVYDYTASAERLSIDSSGYVGIGVASPEVKLHVAGNIWARSSSGGFVAMQPGDATHVGYVGWHKADGTRLGYVGYDNTNLTLALENSADLAISGGDVTMSADLLVSGVTRLAGGYLGLAEVAEPSTSAVYAYLYVDSGDGDLKVKFKNGTVKTLATN